MAIIADSCRLLAIASAVASVLECTPIALLVLPVTAHRASGIYRLPSLATGMASHSSSFRPLTTHCRALKQAPGPSPWDPSKDGPGPNSGDAFST